MINNSILNAKVNKKVQTTNKRINYLTFIAFCIKREGMTYATPSFVF